MTRTTRRVTKRRRGRLLLVSVLGIGVAAWAVRRGLDERLVVGAGGLDDGWDTLQPAPRPVPEQIAPEPVAAQPGVPGAVPSLEGGSSPDPDYTIKGKVAAKVFHAPGSPYYTRTRADVWFRTADDARAAGFTERVRRPA